MNKISKSLENIKREIGMIEKELRPIAPLPEGKFRFHLICLAHARTHPDYSYCAFTTLIRSFSKMMYNDGHEVIGYAVEGSDFPCTEIVTCLDNKTFMETFSDNENQRYQYQYSWENGTAWPSFAENVKRELRERIVCDGKDIVIVTGGGHHSFVQAVCDEKNVPVVDPHIGHSHPFSQFKVFASKTWRSFYYGQKYDQLCKEHYPPPFWYDAVIYHYLDWDDFNFELPKKEDYAVFIGRLNQDKGIYDAIRTCRELKIPLKIIGAPYSQADENQFMEFISNDPEIEYIGTLQAKERNEVVSKAVCQFCTSYYTEPFGMVAIESMACGTPVIATDWGAFTETVVHGVTGFRCSYFSDIKTAVRSITKIKPETCRKWIYQNFTIDSVLPYYQSYFKRVMKIHQSRYNWYEDDIPAPVIQELKNV